MKLCFTDPVIEKWRISLHFLSTKGYLETFFKAPKIRKNPDDPPPILDT